MPDVGEAHVSDDGGPGNCRLASAHAQGGRTKQRLPFKDVLDISQGRVPRVRSLDEGSRRLLVDRVGPCSGEHQDDRLRTALDSRQGQQQEVGAKVIHGRQADAGVLSERCRAHVVPKPVQLDVRGCPQVGTHVFDPLVALKLPIELEFRYRSHFCVVGHHQLLARADGPNNHKRPASGMA